MLISNDVLWIGGLLFVSWNCLIVLKISMIDDEIRALKRKIEQK